MSKESLVTVGKISGVHGIKGEIKVFPYGDLEGISWSSVFLTGRGREEPCKVKRVRRHKGVYILELEAYPDRNSAESLVGLELSVERAELPELEEDEYYYTDLIGMDVWSDDSKYIGKVTNIIPTGANDVLEVDGPFGSVLIPAIENVLIGIETENRKITIRLIEGLLPD